MATPDGISTDDWDVVHELAVELVNHADEPIYEDFVRRLFTYLDSLEAKYGPLASILATRAEYMDDGDPEKEEFLLQAYTVAQASGDKINSLYIAHSLTDLYVERRNPIDAGRWLQQMHQHLPPSDGYDATEYDRLQQEIRRLIGRHPDALR